jgi:hypothetical protein
MIQIPQSEFSLSLHNPFNFSDVPMVPGFLTTSITVGAFVYVSCTNLPVKINRNISLEATLELTMTAVM